MKPTIFFVPGAWHKPWVFDLVRETLSSRGYETDAIALATAGSDDKTVGVLADAAKIRDALSKLVDAGKDVLVVPHSYGGVPTSSAVQGLSKEQRAADGKPGGIIMLLYMASFTFPAGTSLLEALDGVFPPFWNVASDFITTRDAVHTFYADVEPSLADKAATALVRMPYQMVIDKANYEPWKHEFRVGYIFAEKDEALPISRQRALASQFPAGSFTASLESSHSPFLSMPQTLADTLEDAIRHASDHKGL
ncbi:Alpha/beta hydrolase fold-1 [Nemania sp. FL0916]|nr:Alpha/beta hydrolase fold-1 [Nemania sp. FL0916]